MGMILLLVGRENLICMDSQLSIVLFIWTCTLRIMFQQLQMYWWNISIHMKSLLRMIQGVIMARNLKKQGEEILDKLFFTLTDLSCGHEILNYLIRVKPLVRRVFIMYCMEILEERNHLARTMKVVYLFNENIFDWIHEMYPC